MPHVEVGITEAQITQRCFDLHAAFEYWKNAYESLSSGGQKLRLDPSCLYVAVVSYFDDIARFKSYHLQDPKHQKADAVKQATFAVKWLAKLKPISVERPIDVSQGNFVLDNDDDSVMINEAFAVGVAMTYLKVRLQKEKHAELMYDLCYRRLTDDGLLLFFQTLQDMKDDKKVIR